jgi:hypothetical protein
LKGKKEDFQKYRNKNNLFCIVYCRFMMKHKTEIKSIIINHNNI